MLASAVENRSRVRNMAAAVLGDGHYCHAFNIPCLVHSPGLPTELGPLVKVFQAMGVPFNDGVDNVGPEAVARLLLRQHVTHTGHQVLHRQNSSKVTPLYSQCNSWGCF